MSRICEYYYHQQQNKYRAIILTVIQKERWAICPCFASYRKQTKNSNKNQHACNGIDTWISNFASVFAQKRIVCENQWRGRKVWKT